MTNRGVKEKMIKIFGEECFIDKLHLRKDKQVYKGSRQYKRMKKLTYHHIIEKSKGGPNTIENGAILSVENHEWFNKQTKEKQEKLNQAFQEYKRKVEEDMER